MILTANEGRQQHSFFIPQLGPAPKWCAFLDNLVEEMAEDASDPNTYGTGNSGGEIYDNYKFLTLPQLRQLNMDHLIGSTSLLRPYMHGYFVAQRLYEEAKLIANPEMWEQQRAKSVKEKIEKERESRIRGNKKVKVKVNKKLAQRIMEREEKQERWRARKVLENGGDDVSVEDEEEEDKEAVADDAEVGSKGDVLHDPRFARLFEDADFEIDETSREFKALNPSTRLTTTEPRVPKGLTAVEEEEMARRRGSSSEESSAEEDEAPSIRAPVKATKSGDTQRPQRPRMVVSSSTTKRADRMRDKSFGARAAALRNNPPLEAQVREKGVVGEREIVFSPMKKSKQGAANGTVTRDVGDRHRRKDRRSASGNVFRRM